MNHILDWIIRNATHWNVIHYKRECYYVVNTFFPVSIVKLLDIYLLAFTALHFFPLILSSHTQTYRKSSKDVAMPTPEHKEKQPVHSTFTEQHHKRLSPSPPSSRDVSTPGRPFSQTAGLILSLSSAPDHSEIKSLEELFPIASDHDDTQSEMSVLSDGKKHDILYTLSK